MMLTKVLSGINQTPSKQVYNHNSQLSHGHIPFDSRDCNRLMPSISRQWTEETSCFSSVEPQSQRVNQYNIEILLHGWYISIRFGSPHVAHCSYLHDVQHDNKMKFSTKSHHSFVLPWFRLYGLNLVPSRRVVWFLIMFILIYSAHDIHTGTRNLEEITESLLC